MPPPSLRSGAKKFAPPDAALVLYGWAPGETKDGLHCRPFLVRAAIPRRPDFSPTFWVAPAGSGGRRMCRQQPGPTRVRALRDKLRHDGGGRESRRAGINSGVLGEEIAEAEVFREPAAVLQPGLLALGIPCVADADFVRADLSARSATMGHGATPLYGTQRNPFLVRPWLIVIFRGSKRQEEFGKNPGILALAKRGNRAPGRAGTADR